MVKIIADSTCDLSKELLEKYDIDILPLHIRLDEQEYEDGKNITPEEIFRWSDEHKTTPKTSAPSLEDAVNLLKPYVEQKRQIVCFAISQEMSTSANVMRLAAAELDGEALITVIDSRSLSTGIGLLVVEAAAMAKEGQDAASIAYQIEQLIPRVRASFVVDTLVYLHRGGRCSGLAALLGSAIKLHPKIVVEEGVMRSDKKYRGKMGFVIHSYVKDLEADLRTCQCNRVFITHSGCDTADVEKVRQYLEGMGRFNEIIETRAGGVISSHCGPGTLGVLFIAERNL